jgi:hypothetical protein
MNKPYDNPNDPDLDGDLIGALKAHKPCAPRIDWDAINAARVKQDSESLAEKTTPATWSNYRTFALAGCSGLAVGAALTFLMMNWFIMSKLHAKIAELERATSIADLNSVQTVKTNETTIARSDSLLELYLQLDSPLSVGTLRGRPDRFIHTHSTPLERTSFSAPGYDEPDPTQGHGPLPAERYGFEPPEKTPTRRQLLNELQESIY